MFRAFKTCSFVLPDSLGGSQGCASQPGQLCTPAWSRMHVFELLLSIWLNIQICWHTPAAENEGPSRNSTFQVIRRLFMCSKTERSIWGWQSRAQWVLSLPLQSWSTTRKRFERWGLKKGNTPFSGFSGSVCWEGSTYPIRPRQGLLWTLCSWAALSKGETPHAQIPPIPKAWHQPQVGIWI